MIVLAVLGAFVSGAMQPLMSILFAKLLFVLTIPIDYITVKDNSNPTLKEKYFWVEEETKWLCILFVIYSVVSSFGPFFKKFFFGRIGTTVTD